MKIRFGALFFAVFLATTARANAQQPWEENEEVSAEILDIAPADQRLGVGFGMQLSVTGQTPGGARITGEYDRKLTDPLWLDLHTSVVIGSSDSACSLESSGAYDCDHGLADGFSFQVGGSLIVPFAARGLYEPYVKAGGELGIVSFDEDDVSGVLAALRFGGGVRYTLNETTSLFGEGQFAVGRSSLSGSRQDPDSTVQGWLDITCGILFSL